MVGNEDEVAMLARTAEAPVLNLECNPHSLESAVLSRSCACLSVLSVAVDSGAAGSGRSGGAVGG
jgi:hypothetical protein